MTTPDNLTDEQREALGRGLQDLLLGRSPFEAGWFESAASALYLAGRDDERKRWSDWARLVLSAFRDGKPEVARATVETMLRLIEKEP